MAHRQSATRADKLCFNMLLTRYALERMLSRLSISEQRGQFLLGLVFAEIPHLENLFYRQPNALQVL